MTRVQLHIIEHHRLHSWIVAAAYPFSVGPPRPPHPDQSRRCRLVPFMWFGLIPWILAHIHIPLYPTPPPCSEPLGLSRISRICHCHLNIVQSNRQKTSRQRSTFLMPASTMRPNERDFSWFGSVACCVLRQWMLYGGPCCCCCRLTDAVQRDERCRHIGAKQMN